MKATALAALVALAACSSARADVLPYRVFWSFPADDKDAIEIDDADLGGTRFDSRWELAASLVRCGRRAQGRGAREVRVESLDGAGAVRSVARCVLTLVGWKKKLGDRMVDRLEEELDAHVSFLTPRKYPGMPLAPKAPESTADPQR